MGGEVDSSLDYPEMPPFFMPIVHSFNDLSEYTFQEIKAYKEMTGITLDLFDVGLIKDIEYIQRSIAQGAKIEDVMRSFNYGRN